MVFVLWSLIKGIVYIVLGNAREQAPATSANPFEIPSIEVAILILAVLLVVAFFDIFVRFRIGMSALSVSKGARKGPAYVVFAIILIIVDLAALSAGLYLSARYASVGNTIVTSIVDLTSTFAVADVVRCSIRLRRLGCTPEGR